MKVPARRSDRYIDFSFISRALYPVLEEPEYMEESEESALDDALNNHTSLQDINFSPMNADREKKDVANMPFRGANETMEAIATDFLVCTECFVCRETVFGIQNAAYLICPQCYTYFPNTVNPDPAAFGLALGFDTRTLMECQAEILALHEASF